MRHHDFTHQQSGPWQGPGPVRRQRRGRGHHGGPWDLGPGFGPGFGPGGRRRGPRVRRGDVRHAILDVLAAAGEDALNGYQVIHAIADRTEGSWKPSPGSVYPTVSQLEDEGLVTVSRDGGRKVLRLTPDGVRYVHDHADEVAAVWSAVEDDSADGPDLRRVIKQTMAAVGQILATGTPAQVEQAREILADTRKRLYLVLAEGDED